MTDFAGAWDCPYCGTNKIWGFVFDCPGCSRPRPRGIRFYLPEGAPVLTKDQKELIGNDPNWYCEHCDSGNKSDQDLCWKCDAPKGSSLIHEVRHYEEGEVPRTTEEAAAADDDESPVIYADEPYVFEPVSFEPEDLTPARRMRVQHGRYQTVNENSNSFGLSQNLNKILPFVAVGAVLLLIATAVYMLFFNTHELDATVVGHSWSQHVTLEEYRTVHEEGWSVPAGGRITHSETRDTGRDRKVSDGYTTETYTGTCTESHYVSKTCTRDNGNGSFTTYECGSYETKSYSCPKTRQVELYHYEDIFDTWYIYDIERWIVIGTYPTSGDDHNPFFDPEPQPMEENQRRVEHQGEYTVFFWVEDEDIGEFGKRLSYEEWLRYGLGDQCTVIANTFDQILEIKQVK